MSKDRTKFPARVFREVTGATDLDVRDLRRLGYLSEPMTYGVSFVDFSVGIIYCALRSVGAADGITSRTLAYISRDLVHDQRYAWAIITRPSSGYTITLTDDRTDVVRDIDTCDATIVISLAALRQRLEAAGTIPSLAARLEFYKRAKEAREGLTTGENSGGTR